MTAITE